MYAKPKEVDTTFGLVNHATTFLAGYGIYVCTSTDRFVGRMLDADANIHKTNGHAFFGAFDSNKYTMAQAYCRAGRYANAIRMAVGQMERSNILHNHGQRPRHGNNFYHHTMDSAKTYAQTFLPLPLKKVEGIWKMNAKCSAAITIHD